MKKFERILKRVFGFERVDERKYWKSNRSPHERIEDDEKEEEVKTSGAGALVGMVCGGLLGLLYGPTEVTICSLLGAIIGNQIEYEQERRKRIRKNFN